MLVEFARQGKTVCRLKGGDPFVFGRGGEEAQALVEQGIPFEVVPGVTSAIAVPAYAGIPVTHRACSSSVAFVTGHEDGLKEGSSLCWDKLATGVDTLVFLMGVTSLPKMVEELLRHGRSPDTPVALVRWGTYPFQETVTGTLANIVNRVQEAKLHPPAVTVVGDVVHLREELRWFDTRPLFGKRIVVTRARAQAPDLSELLREQGAEPIEFPVIRIEPLDFRDRLAEIAAENFAFAWVIFTSVNGVDLFWAALREWGYDARVFGGTKIAAIGPATAAALANHGLQADYCPPRFIAEEFLAAFPEEVAGQRILIPRAREARELIPEELARRGAEVEVLPVYETLPDGSGAEEIAARLARGEVDLITFTSSSTVRNFFRLLGDVKLDGVLLAAIGPATADTLREFGRPADIVAEEHTIPGLVEAMVRHLGDVKRKT
jgi:uroporphyrinogen III methyltransferase/synthase